MLYITHSVYNLYFYIVRFISWILLEIGQLFRLLIIIQSSDRLVSKLHAIFIYCQQKIKKRKKRKREKNELKKSKTTNLTPFDPATSQRHENQFTRSTSSSTIKQSSNRFHRFETSFLNDPRSQNGRSSSSESRVHLHVEQQRDMSRTK